MSRPGPAEILLGLISLLASAGLAEVYLQRFNPIESALFEIHPRYLYRLVPGSRRLFFRSLEDGGPARVLVTINRDGFRGPEISPRKRGLRLIVYGDSFVLATLSELDDTLPKQLEKKLSAALRLPVEAVNAGVTGYGPDQVSLRIEDEIGPLAVDLLIVAVYAGNDFGDLVRNKIYRPGPDGQLAMNHYRLSRLQVEQFPDKPWEVPRSMLVRGLARLFERSSGAAPNKRQREPRSPEASLEAYLAKAKAEYEDAIRDGRAKVGGLFADTYNADVSLTPDALSARYAATLMERVLVRIAHVAASHGVPVLFVFIPSAADVGTGPEWSGWARAVARYPGYRRDGLTTFLSRIAEQSGLEYLDLFDSFEKAGASSLYFPKDLHWNPAGQELAAELAMRHIIARGLVGRQSQGVPVMKEGSLPASALQSAVPSGTHPTPRER